MNHTATGDHSSEATQSNPQPIMGKETQQQCINNYINITSQLNNKRKNEKRKTKNNNKRRNDNQGQGLTPQTSESILDTQEQNVT